MDGLDGPSPHRRATAPQAGAHSDAAGALSKRHALAETAEVLSWGEFALDRLQALGETTTKFHEVEAK